MYLVEWSQLAVERLTQLLTSLTPGDWERVVAAVNQLDSLMAEESHGQGESRTGNDRVTFVEPLGVLFEVNAADRRVNVLAAWWLRSRNR